MSHARKPDALRALEDAKRSAQARAKEERDNAPPPPDVGDLDEAECFVRLVIGMYAYKLQVAMGIMPDGMAIWLRLRIPPDSSDPRAGMVSFVASDDTSAVLRKAVCALESTAQSNFWKVDQFARGRAAQTIEP